MSRVRNAAPVAVSISEYRGMVLGVIGPLYYVEIGPKGSQLTETVGLWTTKAEARKHAAVIRRALAWRPSK